MINILPNELLSFPPKAHPVRDLVNHIRKATKIIVIAGAGISVSGGVPDFRSAEGLFATILDQYPGQVLSGEDLFSHDVFDENPHIFYKCIAELRKTIDKARPSSTHKFLETMRISGRLARIYTQNIDGLEFRQDVNTDTSKSPTDVVPNYQDVIQLHGDTHHVYCTKCKSWHNDPLPLDNAILDLYLQGKAPPCPRLPSKCSGELRPAVLLYGERHPQWKAISKLMKHDQLPSSTDLVLVLGTSLNVASINELITDLSRNAPVIVVNRENVVRSTLRDCVTYQVLSDLETWWDWIDNQDVF